MMLFNPPVDGLVLNEVDVVQFFGDYPHEIISADVFIFVFRDAVAIHDDIGQIGDFIIRVNYMIIFDHIVFPTNGVFFSVDDWFLFGPELDQTLLQKACYVVDRYPSLMNFFDELLSNNL